ncbi:MAG: hypothetical protein KDB22_10445 [Planctomycetales bacterium]|nr:hypothetical protein [Planctomycetales bacterium]
MALFDTESCAGRWEQVHEAMRLYAPKQDDNGNFFTIERAAPAHRAIPARTARVKWIVATHSSRDGQSSSQI